MSEDRPIDRTHPRVCAPRVPGLMLFAALGAGLALPALAQDARYATGSSEARRAPPPPPPMVLAAPGQVRAATWPAPPAAAQPSVQPARPPAVPPAFAPDAPCDWLPDTRSAAPPQAPGPAGTARETPAEAAALRAQIDRIGAFFKAQPAIHPAIGVCPIFHNRGSARQRAEGFAMVGFFGVGYWPAEWLERRNGRLVFDGEIGHAWVDVNQIRLDGSRFTIRDARGEMFEPVAVTHEIQGFPVYGGGQFIVTRHDRPLFRPASTERLLRWQLAEIATALPPAQAQAEREAANLQRMSSPEQLARDEQTLQRRAQLSFGGDLSRARASWEAERAAEMERLRARADTTRPDHPVALLTQLQADSQARLAALTPERAAEPGCLSPRIRGTTVVDVVPVDDPACVRPMVEPNPDYFDRTLPPSAIQVISFREFDIDPDRRGAKRDRAARASFFWGVDWQQLRREVLGGP